MRIDQPLNMTPFFQIAADTSPPSIVLETAVPGPHLWTWEMRWEGFAKSGSRTTTGGRIDLKTDIADIGGTLNVSVQASGRRFNVSLPISGKNPSWSDMKAYLTGKTDSDGFADILWHESKGRHFDNRGVPVLSFDRGYGVCQLTKPAPTFEQAWSWKKNIDAGLDLFRKKTAEARTYLGKHGGYTPQQLRREAVCRWNGGAYHSWIGGKWVRNPTILCDGKTGNIGWDMSDPDNRGKTEAQLHARDKDTYSRGRQNIDEWRYYGICYADAILG